MGFALAAAAADRGAKVILVSAAPHTAHHGVEIQRVDTAEEMQAELRSQLRGADLLLMAAAVGDFRPAHLADRKIRREETPSLSLELAPIPDLVASLASDPELDGVFRVGFAAGSAGEPSRYGVPEGVEVVRGPRVTVPFGRGSPYGFVVSLGPENRGVETKPIATAGAEPLLLPHQVELARLVADHYWIPLIEVIRAMLPPRIRASGSAGSSASSRQTRHSRLLELATRPAAALHDVVLTEEQTSALEVINSNPVTLLHGVIASGKTEVYLAAAEEALSRGLRVLLLVPEISLTPQLVQRVRARLKAPVALLQSQLTELERAQQWWRTRRGEAQVVLGSRSAVFAPIPRLGLICLDEEGSAPYQPDRTPRYETGWGAGRPPPGARARAGLGSA